MKHYRAALRQGTRATKNRELVSGAGKKLWKQKGTGRARIASIRSPLWRHGGTVHGPKPRSYEYAFPQKKLMGALRSAIAAKIADGKLTVVESFDADRAEDQALPRCADKLEAARPRCWWRPAASSSEKLYLGSRNLEGVELVLTSEVHPYDLLRYEHAIFSKDAIEALQETLKKFVRSAARQRRRRLRNANPLHRYSPPADHRKGHGREGNQNTLVFEVDTRPPRPK